MELLEQDWQKNIDLSGFYDANEAQLNEAENEQISPIYHKLHEVESRYREESYLSAGGEKKIYRVYDASSDRFVAMARAQSASLHSEKEQFLREARLTAALQHPNIMTVHDMGVDESDEAFFTMELLQGETLGNIIEKLKSGDNRSLEKYPREELLQIFLKTCDAVAYAHSRQVVHMDLKPENISIGRFGDVIVFDWGLAQVLDSSNQRKTSSEINLEMPLNGDLLNDLTLKGKIQGTPGFMSPEQVRGEEAHYSADIYSLGVILYMLLTYELPTKASNVKTILKQTEQGELRSPLELKGDLAPSLVAVTMKALATEPSKRYTSASEIKAELQKYINGFATEAEQASFRTQIHLLIKRNFTESLLIGGFILALSLVILAAFEQVKSEKLEAIKNFELYKQQVESTRLITRNLRDVIQQSAWTEEPETLELMIAKIDESLEHEEDEIERDWMWEKKGEYHFILEQFNQAHSALIKLPKHQLTQVAEKFAKIKTNDQELLTPKQLTRLFAENNQQTGKIIYYKVFYFHLKRALSIDPQAYLPVIKNVLDLLNNVSHSNFSDFKLQIRAKGNHLVLKEAPYSSFILPLPTTEPLNVLKPLNLNSISVSHSKVNDLERFIGLNLPYIEAVDIPLNIYKLKVVKQYIGLKTLVIDSRIFNKNELRVLRNEFNIKDISENHKP